MMNAEIITHATLRELAGAGAVRQASAVADGDRWSLVVSYGGIQKTLAARNSQQARSWANLNSLVKYLADLGIRKFDTDATNFDPNQKTVARPDKSETLKRAHEAAAYQKWFRAQVQKSIDDPRPPVPHNEAVERMNKVLVERIGPRS